MKYYYGVSFQNVYEEKTKLFEDGEPFENRSRCIESLNERISEIIQEDNGSSFQYLVMLIHEGKELLLLERIWSNGSSHDAQETTGSTIENLKREYEIYNIEKFHYIGFLPVNGGGIIPLNAL